MAEKFLTQEQLSAFCSSLAMLLRSGAKIEEINAVRRHISRTNGGRLAEQVLKNGAEIVNISVGYCGGV